MKPVLLYDADCGFCSSVVQFVLEHERSDQLEFAPLDGATAKRILHRHNELRNTDSVVWVDRGGDGEPLRILARSAAALRVARYLGGWWRVLAAFWIVPAPLRDGVYDLVARNRHRIKGRRRCVAPTAENQDRFLD
jgi:predicted DCC family thiol-disulfide oxidoreductase YuxK